MPEIEIPAEFTRSEREYILSQAMNKRAAAIEQIQKIRANVGVDQREREIRRSRGQGSFFDNE